MLKEIYDGTRSDMDKVIEALKSELSKIRTGRANPTVLDSIRINYYGQITPLKQVAGVQLPEPRMILIQPWDKSIINDIEKAIQEANIGVTPQNDGVVVRLPFPPLSEETRKDSLKSAKGTGEKFKVGLRSVRHDTIDLIKAMEKDKELTEDERKKGIDEIDSITSDYVKKVDEILKMKESEIMEI
ncbi:ribosome recycling factor [bacterium]|nr:ribosome recycling factor [bacterium]